MKRLMVSKEIRLASRPTALPEPANFELAETVLPPRPSGQVRVRNHWMSVEPYMRGRMKGGKSYVSRFEIGAPLEGHAVGEVIESGDDRFRPGDMVLSRLGWRELFDAPPEALERLETDKDVPGYLYMDILGVPGFAAYVGLRLVAGVKADDVVFVSAAAGAVGVAACQIARLAGARVIGSAGGADKVAFLRDIGVDGAIDYKASPNLREDLRLHAPEGISVYFDNVGGAQLEAAIAACRHGGRIALCGMISQYNAEKTAGPSNLLLAIGKRLRLQGFIVDDHEDIRPVFQREIVRGLKGGAIRTRQTIYRGLESAPSAFIGLFTGENIGKTLIDLR